MSRPAIRLVAALSLGVLALWLTACAYGLRPGRVRPGIDSVAVPYFENRSDEPGIEVELTESIIDGLIDDRTLRVVEENRADVLLIGVIRRYAFEETFFGADRQAEEYRINVEVEVELVRRSDDETVAGPKSFRGSGSYYLEEGPAGEQAARVEAAEAIVDGIRNLVVEEW